MIAFLWVFVLFNGFKLLNGFRNIKYHDEYSYFVIESTYNEIKEFITTDGNSEYKYENGLYGFEDTHHVISTPKKLVKRAFAESHKFFENKKIHTLNPETRLFKRTPVPIDTTVSDNQNSDADWTGYSEEQKSKIEKVMNDYQINDPLFKKQWHIYNSVYEGNDLNVLKVWDMNITGKGVTVAIVDDGLDYENMDLKENFNAKGSYDFNDKNDLPKPRLADDYHGTRCAGEIAAAKNNDYCGLGVAYNAKVAGIRILSGELTAEEEAASMIYEMNENDIYSCSWGPTDNGREMEKPSDLVSQAMVKGITEGRNNKGNIYVFASGNGANLGDNCNYDGYTNSIYSITVGAIDWQGLHSSYSESCSALLTVTYSSGSNEYIHSTDINNVCSDKHGGTSAAAPLAAGVYALVLEANPNLTWRDLQYLTVESSVLVDDSEDESKWQQPANYFNKKYSHMYGFGKIDAFEIVNKALSWKNVNEQVNKKFDKINVDKSSNGENEYVESKFNITEQDVADFKHLEHITVTIDADAKMRGLTEIDLIAPDGSVSHLAIPRKIDKRGGGFPNWKFMSVVHWGTQPVGEWTLKSRVSSDSNTLKLKSWEFEIFGEKRDAEIAITSSISITTTSEVLEPTSTASEPATTTTASVTTPTETQEGNEHETLKKGERLLKAHHYLGLFMLIFILSFLYYLLFVHKKQKFQRLRAEAYEFDIIDNESDGHYELSDDEFDLDNNEESINFEVDSDENLDNFDSEQHVSGEEEINEGINNTDTNFINPFIEHNGE